MLQRTLVFAFVLYSAVVMGQGIVIWEKDLASARVKAEQQQKPVLLLHLFGRLDEEFT